MPNSIPVRPQAAGRPRSEHARRAILAAANDLLDRDGFAAVTVEAIAARAGVSKATIYRWWPNKAAVIMDGFLAALNPALPFPDAPTAQERVRLQMRAVVRALTSNAGAVIAALIAEGQTDAELAEAFRTRFLAPRRAETRRVLEAGVDRSELRADLDVEVAIDALYGPLYYRLLVGHARLDETFADALAAHVFDGLHSKQT